MSAGDKTIAVTAVGFKRRVLYAPLKRRDLRIGNYLYLQLAGPVTHDQIVEVKNLSKKLWPATCGHRPHCSTLAWIAMQQVPGL